jgi:hypothetical protein
MVLDHNASPRILPASAVLAMVATHDDCCTLADHHLLPGVPPDDLPAIAQKIRGDLDIPVLAMNIGDGWKFEGAGECPVGGYKTAHLLFRRGNQAMSMFSIPASDFHVDADQTYAYAADNTGHLLAGFAKDGALYCLVESGPAGGMSSDQMQQLRDRLERNWTSQQNGTASGEGHTTSIASINSDFSGWESLDDAQTSRPFVATGAGAVDTNGR